MYEFDMAVIGAGSAGISAANLARNLGKRVALIEKRRIGGDCTWYGCVPSKTLIKAAHVAHMFKTAREYGLSPSAGAEMDARRVMAHVRTTREAIYEGERPEVFEAQGIRVFQGSPRFLNPHTIRVADRDLTAAKIVIATGSRPVIPAIEGLADVPFLTNETLFDLELLPASIGILGGGPIGMEMASALNHLGVRVTVIEKGPRVLQREDAELVDALAGHLSEEGIRIATGRKAMRIAREADGLLVTVESDDGDAERIGVEALLVAVGRRPNVEGLDLERAGVLCTPRGIQVDATLRTTAANIYACGDVAGSYQFSHVAEYQAEIAIQNALLPLPIKRRAEYEKKVLWATFTDPELARAGLTEAGARERLGNRVRVYRHSCGQVDRARTDRAESGMSKFVCDRDGKILGIHILAERGADLLHEAQLARMLGAPLHRIRFMIHVYPTYGDLIKRPANAAYVDKVTNHPILKVIRALRR